MAVAPEGTAPPSFVWGGRSWSASDLGTFKKWLAAHGSNYSQWASNHADAAKSVFGALPAAAGSLPGGDAGAGSTQAPATDYESLIEGDPLYQQLKNNLSAQSVSDAAQRAAAIKQALITYGSVPDLSAAMSKLGLTPQDLQTIRGDIGGDTAGLAKENTDQGLSIVARLAAAQKQAQDNLMNNLGSSGLFHSGATGYQLGQQALGAKQSQSDALTSLLNALHGTIGNYTSAEQARQNQLQAGLTDAANRQQALLGSTQPGGPIATPASKSVLPVIAKVPKSSQPSVLRSLIIGGQL